MTRSAPGHGLKLPASLRNKLGLEEPSSKHNGSSYAGPYRTRTEQRKVQRAGKNSRPKYESFDASKVSIARGKGQGRTVSSEEERRSAPARRQNSKTSTQAVSNSELKHPVSILKKQPLQLPPVSSDSSVSSRQSSPGLVLDASSKTYQDRLARDDTDIARLEKKLGIKNKKFSRDSLADGLGGLLEGLDEDDGLKRKRDHRDWSENKRRKVRVLSRDDITSDEDDDIDRDPLEDLNDVQSGAEGESEEQGSEIDYINDEEETIMARGDFADFNAKEKPVVQQHVRKVRENPYLPPITANTTNSKYVPPSLRNPKTSDDQSSERLRRQIQGHLNRLSEANLISILTEVEKLYEINARQDVTSALTELLLSLFSSHSALQNTFVILHAAFTAAIYKVIGTAFGAQILSTVVERFDEYHNAEGTGKESLNLISLLSNLFTFNVIGSNIVYDHIKILLDELTESNTELLLRVIRDCGPQLRQDDPAALKTVVQMVQASAKRFTEKGQKMSVRTQFMIETITDLKNNKLKNPTNAAGLTSEHITRMRKVLGSLNRRNLKTSEPLRISRDDIKHREDTGKWWLVGASWKGNEPVQDNAVASSHEAAQSDPEFENDEIDLVTLSRQYQMNTEIRRSIFIAIMSAADFQDAYMRILKLRLKRAQEAEIPKVLLRCTGAEPAYNPYYGLLAKKLCSEKRLRKNFEFALWAFFKRIGHGQNEDPIEDSDDDDMGSRTDQPVDVHEIANLAKLYGFLISEGSLSLTVLKVLDLLYLKEQAQIFVELLFVTILLPPSSTASSSSTELQKTNIPTIFEQGAAEAPQLIERLRYFMKKHVRKSDLVAKRDREKLKLGCRVAIQALDTLQR